MRGVGLPVPDPAATHPPRPPAHLPACPPITHRAGNPPYLEDVCSGDSGGPLFSKGRTAAADVLLGLTSYGLPCDTKRTAGEPGVYTDVAAIRPWVDAAVACLLDPAKCSDRGERPLPPPPPGWMRRRWQEAGWPPGSAADEPAGAGAPTPTACAPPPINRSAWRPSGHRLQQRDLHAARRQARPDAGRERCSGGLLLRRRHAACPPISPALPPVLARLPTSPADPPTHAPTAAQLLAATGPQAFELKGQLSYGPRLGTTALSYLGLTWGEASQVYLSKGQLTGAIGFKPVKPGASAALAGGRMTVARQVVSPGDGWWSSRVAEGHAWMPPLLSGARSPLVPHTLPPSPFLCRTGSRAAWT